MDYRLKCSVSREAIRAVGRETRLAGLYKLNDLIDVAKQIIFQDFRLDRNETAGCHNYISDKVSKKDLIMITQFV